LKRFINDIAIEVIEAKLISSLDDIFTPIVVSIMFANLVTNMIDEFEKNYT